jgi:hypothetical protein
MIEEINASFRANSEAWRDQYAQGSHFSKVGALTSKEVIHICFALGIFISESISIFLRHITTYSNYLKVRVKRVCMWNSVRLSDGKLVFNLFSK